MFNGAEGPIADAIRLLQAPGFEQGLWHVLHRVAAPDNLAILIYRHAGAPEILHTQISQFPVFAELRSTYTDGAYLFDPYYDLHLNRIAAGIYRLLDVAPDAFQQSRYFIEYYDQTTLIDELAFIAYPAQGVTLTICRGRDQSTGQNFTARQIEACQRIAPVVVALADRHWSGVRSGTNPSEDIVGTLIFSALKIHGFRLS